MRMLFWVFGLVFACNAFASPDTRLKTRAPLTADSRLGIGSISKAFTSIALLQLADEHRFDAHAPITKYLPWLDIHSGYKVITGHDLMSHTAGLPNYLTDAASSRFVGIELKTFEPTYAPGAHWAYPPPCARAAGYDGILVALRR